MYKVFSSTYILCTRHRDTTTVSSSTNSNNNELYPWVPLCRIRETHEKWRICRLDFSLVHAAACPINVVQMSECISVGCKRGSKWSSFIPRWFGYCDRESWQCREYPPFIRGPTCRYCRSVSLLGS